MKGLPTRLRTVGDGSPVAAAGPLKLASLFLGAFALVAYLVGSRRLEAVDLAVMAATQRVTGPALDLVSGLLNYAAAAEVSLALMLLLSLWIRRRGLAWPRAGAPLAFLASFPIELALKLTLEQPVPREFYRRTLSYALAGLNTVYSFPSGHAIRSAFMAVLVGYVGWRWLGLPARPLWTGLTLLVLVLGWSRYYQGHHWPTDVLGGNLFGIGLALVAIAVLDAKTPRSSPAGTGRRPTDAGAETSRSLRD